MNIPALSTAHRGGGGTAVSAVLQGVCRPDAVPQLLALLKKQAKRYRKALSECKKEFSESAVHASRIETRRLLAMLELLAPWLGQARLNKARAALKRHLDTFDDLRDTHVQLLAVRPLKKRFPCVTSFEDYLLCREKRVSRRTRKQVKRIESRRWSKRLGRWSKELDETCARQKPERSLARLRGGPEKAFAHTATLMRKIDPADPNTIHCTRVAFKRFRYMIETLVCLAPGRHQKLLAALHAYQTRMGEIQDAEVLLGAYKKFLGKHESKGSDVVLRELLRHRDALIKRYLERANQLHAFSPQIPPASSKAVSTRQVPPITAKPAPFASRAALTRIQPGA